MKQLAVTGPAALMLAVWLYDFMTRLLFAVWPVAYMGLIALLTTATLMGIVAIIRVVNRATRAPAQEIIDPPTGVLMQSIAAARPTIQTVSQSKFTEDQLIDLWNREVCILCFIASSWYQDDFTIRRLSHHITDPGWRHITGMLYRAGVLTKGKGGTQWARGWDYYRLRAAIKHHRLRLDPPRADKAPYSILRPPTVEIYPPTHTPTTPHTPTTEATL